MIFWLICLFAAGEALSACPDPRPVKAGDLVITEIMADPSPSQGQLPEEEYVEIFNRSGEAIRVDGVSFVSGNSLRPLPALILPPGGYAILCDEASAGAFAVFGQVAAIRGFPAISNNGGALRLQGAGKDTLLNQIYRLSWYRDGGKDEGGWSLEIIDPYSVSNCAHNWSASADPGGGSPGRANSPGRPGPERDPPVLLRASAPDPRELILYFNEGLAPAQALDKTRYRISPAVAVEAVLPGDADLTEVHLLLEPALEAGLSYTVTAESGLADCLGSASRLPQSIRFGLPQQAGPFDVVINELLFDPKPGGYDFIELYNRSAKIIDLNDLYIRHTPLAGTPGASRVSRPFLLFPGDLAVITEDTSDLLKRYRVARPAALLKNDLPALDSRGGRLVILAGGMMLDSFDYSPELHSALIRDRRGVSLERIDAEVSAQHSGNWFSAAASSGFATPTGPNSQRRGPLAGEEEPVSLPYPRFSPDGDGSEDVLLIRLHPKTPGYLLNLDIFDLQGRPVRSLVKGLPLQVSDEWLSWDGSSASGGKARTGIYLLSFVLFHPGGAVIRKQVACVLAGEL